MHLPLGELVPDAVLVDDVLAVLEGSVVEVGGTGSNGGQIVAHDVGQDQGIAGVGESSLGQVTSLNDGEMLTNAVDFVNGGAAGQQDVGGLADVIQSDVGSRSAQQSTASTTDEGDDYAVLGLVFQGLEQSHGTGNTVLIRDGVSSFGNTNSLEMVSSSVLVLGNDMAGVNAVTEEVFGSFSHTNSSLTATNNNDRFRIARS